MRHSRQDAFSASHYCSVIHYRTIRDVRKRDGAAASMQRFSVQYNKDVTMQHPEQDASSALLIFVRYNVL
jgi:hypothetical protein